MAFRKVGSNEDDPEVPLLRFQYSSRRASWRRCHQGNNERATLCRFAGTAGTLQPGWSVATAFTAWRGRRVDKGASGCRGQHGCNAARCVMSCRALPAGPSAGGRRVRLGRAAGRMSKSHSIDAPNQSRLCSQPVADPVTKGTLSDGPSPTPGAAPPVSRSTSG